MLRRTTALAGLLALSFTACATVDHGPMQRIRVESSPSGADVKTEECGPGSTKRARTPGMVWVNRRASRCAITFTRTGYYAETILLRRGISDATAENIRLMDALCLDDCTSLSDWFGMVILSAMVAGTGVGVDAVTGAMFEQEPNYVSAELHPEEWRTRSSP